MVLISRIFEALQADPKAVLGENSDVSFRLHECTSLKELHTEVWRILQEILKNAVLPQKKVPPDLAEKMTEYVNANYCRDISLFDLADHLSLSRNYVSTLFKNAIGHNFKSYLSEIRFQKACELMQSNKNIRIKQVAAQVGCSTDILARLFMRYAGTSPTQYQMNMQNGV